MSGSGRPIRATSRLLSLDRGIRALLAGSIACGALSAACAVAAALAMASVIAEVFVGGRTLEAVMPLLLGAALLAVGRAGLLVAEQVVAQRSSSRLRGAVRSVVMGHLLLLGPVWLSGQRAGEVASTVTSGIDDLDAWLTSYQPARALAGIVPCLVLLVVLLLDPPTALVLVLTGPVLVLLLAVIGSRARSIGERRVAELRWLSAFFLDMLRGIATLKAFGRSREQADTIREVSDQYGATTMEVLRTAFQTALVLEWAGAVATAVVAVEISLRLMAGQIPFAVAMGVLIITPEFFLPLRSLAIRYHAGAAGRSSAERLVALLDVPLPPRASGIRAQADAFVRPSTGAVTPRPARPSGDIVFRDVWAGYPERPAALRGVELAIREGRVVALVGASGAGKTTIANLLLRFIDPERGSILAGGSPIEQIDRSTWLAGVAWVPQRPHLPWATVAETIRMARPEATLDEVVAAARDAHADEFIRALPLGYATHLGEGAQRLSGGERQRLAIARAFLRDAPLLILDEPTSHLDAASEAAIGDAIGRLVRGRTVLVISHRLRLADLADEVLVLDAGRVVQSGPPGALGQQDGPYRALRASLGVVGS